MSSSAFGVYVHVPFCARRCDYCAFATWTDRDGLMPDYVAACVAEIGAAAEAGLPPATSVFFGGGTPSRLPAGRLESILAAVPLAPGAEVTVECNPEDVTAARLERYRAAGVTRLSFGVQSMVAGVLRSLGRVHRREAVLEAVAAAGAAGFADAYSVDLIYGAAAESLEDWRETLEGVLALDPAPAHVSAYGLTVETGTPLARDPSRHPDPDDQADKYLLAEELLTGAGLSWYELSNWARPGAECRHNLLYWEQGEYRGFGCAAHSHEHRPGAAARRWWNVRAPERYVDRVRSGRPVEAGGEDLDPTTVAREAAQLSLRTRDGLPLAAMAPGADLDELVDAGLTVVTGDRIRLTAAGRLLANEVTVRLVA